MVKVIKSDNMILLLEAYYVRFNNSKSPSYQIIFYRKLNGFLQMQDNEAFVVNEAFVE